MDVAGAVRAVVAFALLAWLPGWALSRALLPHLGRLERGVVAVVLSVALVALFVYLGNIVAGIRVGAFQAIVVALFLTTLGLGIERLRRPRERSDEGAPRPDGDGTESGALRDRRAR